MGDPTFDKDDYETIGSLKSSVASLDKTVGKLEKVVSKISDNLDTNYVTKEEMVDVKKDVKINSFVSRYAQGVLIGALYVLNFFQNGGIDSLK